MNTKLLTVMEVASILHCSKSGVYQIIKRRDIPRIKIGRRYLFPSDALDEWIHNNCGSGVNTLNEKEKRYG